MKKLILSAAALAVSSLSAAYASPLIVLSTINFDVPGGIVGGNAGPNYGSTPNGAGAAAQGSGADSGGVTSEYWNPIAESGLSTGNLTSNGVTPTGITFSDGAPAQFSFGPPSPITIFNPFDLTHVGTFTDTLNNVPAGTYNLFVYGQNGGFASHGGIYSVNGSATQSIVNAGDQLSFISGVNYTEFTNIVLTSPGTISLAVAQDVNGEGDFNGLQLQVMGVPEPSTWAMSIGGAAVLLFVHRRRTNAKV